MNRTAPLALILMIAAPAVASAHGFSARETEQAGLIEQGRQDGSITWREGLKLRKEQRDIARVENELAADGYLSKKDRRTLWKLQNKAEDDINTEANDSWHRVWFLPRFGR